MRGNSRQNTHQTISMKFNTALSFVGIILLNIEGKYIKLSVDLMFKLFNNES